MNRKGILWVKLSEATAMQFENTRRPQHGMSKITINDTVLMWRYQNYHLRDW